MAVNDSNQTSTAGLTRSGRDGQGLARRHVLQLAGITVLGGVLSACAPASSTAQPSSSALTTPVPTASASSGGAGPLNGTLEIPPLLAPERDGATKVSRLAMQTGEAEFIAGQATATFGFNGNYLGPTLRAAKGDAVRIDVTNDLGEVSTVHWHGMHLPAVMDGGPHQTVAHGSTWSPEFTIQQPAATLWYHPHLMGETRRQVGMGLVGLFILDDQDPANEALPHLYGVDDIPVILQAQTFGSDGQFSFNRGGRGGDENPATTLVNGAISPSINTPDSRLRLRLLNASSEGIYNLGFAGGEAFSQVASDGGLLKAPVTMTRLQLAPAERAEIVVDVAASGSMVLQSFGRNGGGRGGGNNVPAGALLTINSTRESAPPAALPTSLAVIERLSPGSAAQTRAFVLGGNDQNPTINGQSMTSMADMMDMSEAIQVKLGTTEVWNLINRSDDTHAFHVHDIQFQILDRDGSAPPPMRAA